MTSLLEITGDDIAQLDDSDLRTLIGRLCEADYRSEGLSTKGIMWGGNQNARDGGLDVVVRDAAQPSSKSFVPRNFTGFQVKKSTMPPSVIPDEMKPNDILRDEIKNLIQENGAYIILSSGDSTSKSAFDNRIKAMVTI